MHDDRDAVEAPVGLDVAREHVAVHLRHLGIDQNEAQLLVERLIVLRRRAAAMLCRRFHASCPLVAW